MTDAPIHSEHKDYIGSKLGMWFFLFTEIILFGGLFLLYSVYRSLHHDDFHRAATELSVFIGTVNTVILITSSLTVALAINAIKQDRRASAAVLLGVTIALGLLFLVNKYFEWTGHIHEGIYPDSPELLAKSHGTILFYGLYYVMTGLHGIHVIAGMAVLAGVLVMVLRGTVNGKDYVKLENSGLFWHLVDLIWIYLFPLFYLIT
ncbi:MAG: cytochrome c oxidase subunit 3 family protein [Nitrospiraceae bacterium]|nr:cytochrome c oxidase subunit 3 family protein [Nitrospiraceae bacterium]